MRISARVRSRTVWKRVGAAAAVVSLSLGGLAASQLHAAPGDVPATDAEAFVGMTPVRVLDTRTEPASPFSTGETRTLSFSGHVPPTASGVAVTLTSPSGATAITYFTVWPTGDEQPHTSAINPGAPYHQASAALLRLGDNQSVNIYHEQGESHLVVDLMGYFVPLSAVSGIGTGGGGAGTQWFSGPGNPTAGSPAGAADGDYYLNTTDGTIWILDAGAWGNPGGASIQGPPGATGTNGSNGANGSDGTDGSTWHSGTGDPNLTPPTGAVDGDFYLDTATGDVWTFDGVTWTITSNIRGPQGPAGSTTFLSGAQAATVTTVLGGLLNQRALLPLSGVVATAVPATEVAGLLTIDASDLALDVRQPLPVETTVDTITFRATVTAAVALPTSTVQISATLWVDDVETTLGCLATPGLSGLIAIGDEVTCTTTGAPVVIPAGSQAAIVVAADVTAGLDLATLITLNTAAGIA